MIRKVFYWIGVLFALSACASETVRLKETEYLRTHEGKPLVYPAGLDKPLQERSYVIPDLPESNRVITETPEALMQPPRLSGVDLSSEPDADSKAENEETAGKPEQPPPAKKPRKSPKR